MADKGYAPAQAALGVMHRDGQGFAKDDAKAVKWFRKVAEQEDDRCAEKTFNDVF